MMEGDRVVDRFQSLMNAGVRIPPSIEAYTGITNEMIATAPQAATVMEDAAVSKSTMAARMGGAYAGSTVSGIRQTADTPMVAHNASFDRRFWQAELERLGRPASNSFACTLLLSRRLYPQAPNHKLGSLAALHELPSSGRAHRAMADAETAAALLAQIRRDLGRQYGLGECRHELLMQLQRSARHAVPRVIETWLRAAPREH